MGTEQEHPNRVALVTGGTRGIGAAVAVRLAAEGVKVAVNGRAASPAVDGLLASITSQGGEACFVAGDVSDPQAVQDSIDTVINAWGRLDILVCAAGINMDGPFVDMPLENWRRVLDVNLTGTFLTCQAAAPVLKKSGCGTIVTMAAQTAFRGRLNGANYCAAKAGVVALTKCLAQELAPRVRANVVVPGLIETEEVITRLHLDDPEVRQKRTASIPLERLGRPEDVAETVAFLVSDRAQYITGQVWWINGGMVMN